MMLNRIYNTLKFFTNNQVQGNVTPTEFNIATYNRIQDRFEGYFFELAKYINRENRGLITNGHSDVPEKLREKIAYYLKRTDVSTVISSVTGFPTFGIPADCRYLDLVLNTANGRTVEPATDPTAFYRIQNVSHTAPSETFPIYLKSAETYPVLPVTITEVTLFYLRNPIEPNWTYTVVDGVELFNPSDAAFRDADIHPSEETDLTLAILKSFGINLKEEELLKATTSEEMKEFQKENNL